MTLTPLHRLVVLPGVIEHPQEHPSTPVEAVRGLLAGHEQAPHLLSDARHRATVSRESAAEAVQATRLGRNAELAHELAVRHSDRDGRWRVHFGPAAVAVGALLVICWAAAFVLTRALPWPDRVVIPIAAVALGGVAAWRWAHVTRERKGEHYLTVFVAAVLASALVVLCVLTTAGGFTPRIVVSAAFGLVLVTMCALAAWLLDRAENWHCAKLRRARNNATRHRHVALVQACSDEAAAQAALAAWESLVVEECQLAHPGDVVAETWLADCVSTARKIATPG